ncbi:hypothetical protein KY331_04910 [Candidatus Woesearchaeota archaeon]|nr:hypothetical protein [Candidatus Woesearchaeota archaeon]
MEEFVTTTIVPRYGLISASAERLEDITRQIRTKYLRPKDPVIALVADIPVGDLHQLVKLREFVDLIAIRSLDSKALNGDFVALDSLALGVDVPLSLYSVTARPHRGKMSNGGKSAANYHWEIFRPEEPSNGEEPACLIVQSIPSGGLTSRHHHEYTDERFLSLAGKADISIQNGKGPATYCTIENCFFQVFPLTQHQLKTSTPVVNVLYMNPYDPELKDHHYE